MDVGDAPAGALTIGKVGKTEYGTMLITIYAGGTEQTKRRQARASGTRARDQKRGGYFDTDVARLQEFGTKVMNAHPFFFPHGGPSERRSRATFLARSRGQ
ncbi:hypothetical protein ACFSHQ_17995 [Gemmobacter lanyuensis]